MKLKRTKMRTQFSRSKMMANCIAVCPWASFWCISIKFRYSAITFKDLTWLSLIAKCNGDCVLLFNMFPVAPLLAKLN